MPNAEIFWPAIVVRSCKVKVRLNHRFRLREARAAHEALQSRQTTGSIVLLP
jgi:NADPH2:quinone reductase